MLDDISSNDLRAELKRREKLLKIKLPYKGEFIGFIGDNPEIDRIAFVAIGELFNMDIGKAVMKNNGVIYVENKEQFDKRIKNV